MLLIKKIILPLRMYSFLFLIPLHPMKVSIDETLFAQKIREEKDQIHKVGLMIKKLAKEVSSPRRKKLASVIWNISNKYQINSQIFLAIIDTESDFAQHKVSSTGDLSMAQINPKVWTKELARLGRDPLQVERLKQDETYALTKMGEILSILKSRHAKNDSCWYGRYHSHTKFLKKRYTEKVQAKLQMLASI